MAEERAGRPLRPLIPCLENPSRVPPDPPLSIKLPKRPVVRAACSGCRQRKAKVRYHGYQVFCTAGSKLNLHANWQCDGQRPICSRCIKTGQECEYDTTSFESRIAALKREEGELQARVTDLRRLHTSLVPSNTVRSPTIHVYSGLPTLCWYARPLTHPGSSLQTSVER